MTAEEKAKKLVDKYILNTVGFHFDDAKQCALIAVDEILDFDDMHYLDREYWEKVVEEIEKL